MTPSTPATDAEALADRLTRAITTACNDDLSEPLSEKRKRHIERCDAMCEAADFLRSKSAQPETRGDEPVAWQKRNAGNDWSPIYDTSDESLYALDGAQVPLGFL